MFSLYDLAQFWVPPYITYQQHYLTKQTLSLGCSDFDRYWRSWPSGQFRFFLEGSSSPSSHETSLKWLAKKQWAKGTWRDHVNALHWLLEFLSFMSGPLLLHLWNRWENVQVWGNIRSRGKRNGDLSWKTWDSEIRRAQMSGALIALPPLFLYTLGTDTLLRENLNEIIHCIMSLGTWL